MKLNLKLWNYSRPIKLEDKRIKCKTHIIYNICLIPNFTILILILKFIFIIFLVFVCGRESPKNDYRKRKYLVVAILTTKIIKFGVKIFHLMRSI